MYDNVDYDQVGMPAQELRAKFGGLKRKITESKEDVKMLGKTPLKKHNRTCEETIMIKVEDMPDDGKAASKKKKKKGEMRFAVVVILSL